MDSISAIASLLKLGTDQSTTTTGGKTVTAEQTDALIKKMLEGTQGLASVAGGEKAAGMYNSTVNTQLTNDLLTRTAAAAAGESTQSTQTTTTPKTVNPIKSLGLLALLDKDTRDTAKSGISSLSDFLSSSTATDAATSGYAFGTSLDGAQLASSAGDYASSLDSLNWMEGLSTASDAASAASAAGDTADTLDWLSAIGFDL